LSFDLWVGDDHVVADPGTYVYTSLPDARNQYRSAASHSGPRVAGPPVAGLDMHPFALEHPAPGTCLAWGSFGFAGSRRDRYGRTALAAITWSNEAIDVFHGVEAGELHPSRLTSDWHALRAEVPYSPAYGVQSG
jgi:hypothetical protein